MKLKKVEVDVTVHVIRRQTVTVSVRDDYEDEDITDVVYTKAYELNKWEDDTIQTDWDLKEENDGG